MKKLIKELQNQLGFYETKKDLKDSRTLGEYNKVKEILSYIRCECEED